MSYPPNVRCPPLAHPGGCSSGGESHHQHAPCPHRHAAVARPDRVVADARDDARDAVPRERGRRTLLVGRPRQCEHQESVERGRVKGAGVEVA